MNPDQARQITDPLERQRVAVAHLAAAREVWVRAAKAWAEVRAQAVNELKDGRTWEEVAALLGVSQSAAWYAAHGTRGSPAARRTRRG